MGQERNVQRIYQESHMRLPISGLWKGGTAEAAAPVPPCRCGRGRPRAGCGTGTPRLQGHERRFADPFCCERPNGFPG